MSAAPARSVVALLPTLAMATGGALWFQVLGADAGWERLGAGGGAGIVTAVLAMAAVPSLTSLLRSLGGAGPAAGADPGAGVPPALLLAAAAAPWLAGLAGTAVGLGGVGAAVERVDLDRELGVAAAGAAAAMTTCRLGAWCTSALAGAVALGLAAAAARRIDDDGRANRAAWGVLAATPALLLVGAATATGLAPPTVALLLLPAGTALLAAGLAARAAWARAVRPGAAGLAVAVVASSFLAMAALAAWVTGAAADEVNAALGTLDRAALLALAAPALAARTAAHAAVGLALVPAAVVLLGLALPRPAGERRGVGALDQPVVGVAVRDPAAPERPGQRVPVATLVAVIIVVAGVVGADAIVARSGDRVTAGSAPPWSGSPDFRPVAVGEGTVTRRADALLTAAGLHLVDGGEFTNADLATWPAVRAVRGQLCAVPGDDRCDRAGGDGAPTVGAGPEGTLRLAMDERADLHSLLAVASAAAGAHLTTVAVIGRPLQPAPAAVVAALPLLGRRLDAPMAVRLDLVDGRGLAQDGQPAGWQAVWRDGRVHATSLIDGASLDLTDGAGPDGRISGQVVTLPIGDDARLADVVMAAAVLGRRGARPALLPPVFAGEAAGRAIDGPLDREGIRRVITRKTAAVKECYERALHQDPHLRGTTTVVMTIDGVGAVTDVHLRDPAMPAVDACVVTVMARLQFPPHDGDDVTVTYPFHFERTD